MRSMVPPEAFKKDKGIANCDILLFLNFSNLVNSLKSQYPIGVFNHVSIWLNNRLIFRLINDRSK